MESVATPYSRKPIHTIRVGTNAVAEKDVDRLNVKQKKEFGGPIGTLLLMIVLPLFALYLNLMVTQKNPSVRWSTQRTLYRTLTKRWKQTLLDVQCWAVVVTWVTGHVIFSALPIGRSVYGRTLADGRKLRYRCNGFLAFALSVALFALSEFYGVKSVQFLKEKRVPLLATCAGFSLLLSTLLFLKSKCAPGILTEQGNSGCTVYDFFMGRELNPRLLGMDLKFVCELRPGLIGWALLIISDCVVQYRDLESITPPLLLVACAQLLYIADALWFESSIISTMDIIHEGFGFMLIFGDLCWVPATYSLQSHYLMRKVAKYGPVTFTGELDWYCYVPFVILNVVGYFIFRASNSQKDSFRDKDTGASPKKGESESIPTSKGRRILCDGWWAWLRHPNYFGDLLMAWSWAFYCGFSHLLPYFYPIYLTILLISRELRDEKLNLRKYGSAWTAYQQKVPYRLFPRLW